MKITKTIVMVSLIGFICSLSLLAWAGDWGVKQVYQCDIFAYSGNIHPADVNGLCKGTGSKYGDPTKEDPKLACAKSECCTEFNDTYDPKSLNPLKYSSAAKDEATDVFCNECLKAECYEETECFDKNDFACKVCLFNTKLQSKISTCHVDSIKCLGNQGCNIKRCIVYDSLYSRFTPVKPSRKKVHKVRKPWECTPHCEPNSFKPCFKEWDVCTSEALNDFYECVGWEH